MPRLEAFRQFPNNCINYFYALFFGVPIEVIERRQILDKKGIEHPRVALGQDKGRTLTSDQWEKINQALDNALSGSEN